MGTLFIPLCGCAIILWFLTCQACPELMYLVAPQADHRIEDATPCDRYRVMDVGSLLSFWIGLLSIMVGALALYSKLSQSFVFLGTVPFLVIVPGFILFGGSFGILCGALLRKRVM